MRSITFLVYTVLLFALISDTMSAQRASLKVYAGKEFIGDHVHADASLGVAYRYALHRLLYIEPFLRVNYGGLYIGDKNPPNPVNYIGIVQEYAFESIIPHDRLDTGLGRKGFDSHLLTVIHGYQFGIQSSLIKTYRLYAGTGFSIGYMELQSLGEEGDAIVTLNGKETLIWYAIPAYQRGLGLQLSFTAGAEKVWKGGWVTGMRADLDFGSLGFYALGTRMSLCISFGIPL